MNNDDNTPRPDAEVPKPSVPTTAGAGPASPGSVSRRDPEDPSGATLDPQDAAPAGRRRWVLAALGALLVALFAVPFLHGPETDRLPESSRIAGSGAGADGAGCAAPEGTANFDFTLKDMSGRDVRLADYKGKVVLLNFWATWCGPCKVEIPDLVEVYREYKDRGFEVLGVLAMDDPSAEELKSFADAHDMNYPVLRAHQDFEDAHGPLWALPTTFIIDRQGSICMKHLGPITREAVEQEIEPLL